MNSIINITNRKRIYNNYIVTLDAFFVFTFGCTLSEYLKIAKDTLKRFVQKVIYHDMEGQKQMNVDIQRINAAHGLTNGYKSPIAETYNGNGLLENFIRAKLTQR